MLKTISSILVSAAIAGPVLAADVSVEMLNKHPETKERNVFIPAVVEIQPGDAVTWLSVDKGHNVQFVREAVPDGVEKFSSKLNQDVTYTFETPGVYVYKCMPHYGLGMVGIVVVGDDPDNIEAAKSKRYPGKAGKRLKQMFEELG